MDEIDVAIKVDKVSKDFTLPSERISSLKSVFIGLYKNVHRRPHTTLHALKDINLEIKKGEFFGIVGRNGSGKSTLLKILAGIYQPTSGSVKVDGRLVSFIELGVGFNAELTGRENVYLNGAMLGFSKKQVDQMYDSIVSFAELEEFMDQKLKNFSSGMQVRLAFSMATRADADILLIDEVLAVGDADFQRKCFNHFRKLKKQKKTVVFVSHDMGAIREYCDRAILIEKSQVINQGKVNRVASAYTRLFMDEQQNTEIAEEGEGAKRYGNAKAKFLSVQTRQKEYFDMSSVMIDCKIKAAVDIEDLVLGFSIKNEADTQLLGVNTRLLNLRLAPLKKGQTLDFSWEVPNVFNDGSYYIDVAAHDPDGDNYDWWEEATGFIVYKEFQTAYIFMPDIKFHKKEKVSAK